VVLSEGSPPQDPFGASSSRRLRSDGLLTTGDMARLSDNTLRTVRFYEETGILRPLQRVGGGHRLFPRSELGRLRFVTRLRSSGLSLQEIRDLLEMKGRHRGGSAAAEALGQELGLRVTQLRNQLSHMQHVIEELEHARAALQPCTSCSCHDQQFPAQCLRCETMRVAANGGTVLSALWDISE